MCTAPESEAEAARKKGGRPKIVADVVHRHGSFSVGGAVACVHLFNKARSGAAACALLFNETRPPVLFFFNEA
jgi:hypothetical protein